MVKKVILNFLGYAIKPKNGQLGQWIGAIIYFSTFLPGDGGGWGGTVDKVNVEGFGCDLMLQIG